MTNIELIRELTKHDPQAPVRFTVVLERRIAIYEAIRCAHHCLQDLRGALAEADRALDDLKRRCAEEEHKLDDFDVVLRGGEVCLEERA